MFIPEACLFDLDGLLIDTEVLHGEAWSQTGEKFGISLTREQLLLLRGRRRAECANQIIKWMKNPAKASQLLSVHEPISRLLLSQSEAMPGAKELLQECFSKNIPMALVTSSSSSSVSVKTSPHPWLKIIKTHVFGDDPLLKEGKPSPEPYLLAAQKLNADTKRCWAMEDSIAGVQSALAAGCQVWVLNQEENLSHPNSRFEDCNPIHINHLNSISEMLKKCPG